MNYPEFEKLVQVVKKLRDPQEGCLWNRRQTHQSLTHYLIEETYEFLHALESENKKEMEEELGDVLLQVLLHTTLAEEKESFNLESVSQVLAQKLMRRHPHVFGKLKGQKITLEQIIHNWEENKKQEKSSSYQIDSSLLHAPALSSAYKIGQKTAQVQFDWDDPQQVSYKVEEEWQELKEELMANKINQKRVQEELGDLLFSIAQLARHLKINPEQALQKANHKFVQRFNKMEALIEKEPGKNRQEMTQEQLDHYWRQVKDESKSSTST